MTATPPIRAAIIGLGHIGVTHVAALARTPGLVLAAASDRQPHLSEVLPKGVPFFDSHRSMLDHGGFDTVIVATPNSTHNAIAVDALRAGFNVIVEKPAAVSMAEFDALERAAAENGRHIYYAFHAATGYEVSWLAGHLREARDRYGPLTGFHCRFFDPYVDETGEAVPHAASLDDCWSDSGVNALSVLDRVFPVDRLMTGPRRQSRSGAGVLSVSVSFRFPAGPHNGGGFGVIDTAWDQGMNFKCTELHFGATGWTLEANHTAQTVTALSPAGEQEELVRFDGDRLLNHYLGLFSDYCTLASENRMNGEAARRIHDRLFSAEQT